MQLLWELYFVFWGILPRLVPHFGKTLLMAPCICLQQSAFVMLDTNMYQRKLEIPFSWEPNITKLLNVIASIQDNPQRYPLPDIHIFVCSAFPPTLYQTWSVWPKNRAEGMACHFWGFLLSFSRISHFGWSRLLCLEAVLWRGTCVQELRPPANSHVSELYWKLSLTQSFRSLQPLLTI